LESAPRAYFGEVYPEFMRIDAKGTIAGKPALLVRDCLRTLRALISWKMATLEVAASLEPGAGKSLLRALSAAGLVKSVGRGWWEITEAGQRLSSASAAKPITRGTAERALGEFLTRVERVNRDASFLGRVNRVVLFGSMLRADVDRLSDVDLAVEVLPKIADRRKLAVRNMQRVESLLRRGYVFRDIFDVELHWRREVFQFLKRRSRVLSLADYAAEKSLIMNVPHRMLLGEEEYVPTEPPPTKEPPPKRSRRPRNCPF
jgi:predicted nucleotidyltransferase